ncbi:TonB-dependent receptor [Saccharophagus sp. K07]|uniref:TonB-dependent receptor family protein n=1 Tax=Saccharophagus sp. K07 TaxID=2283636 RepID=UPI00165251D8|nr:TonB-dependent receptor [Saccharophagus sp. K07]MBC6906556.1 TonB-dependent receptor [Saccharophagus sp. K07]
MPRPSFPSFLSRPLTLAIAAAGLAIAQTGSAEESPRLPTINVVGQTEGDAARQPGAVAIVTTEELELKQPRSTEEALRAVPGVAIKGEEESAIVVNIGIRGLSSADYKTLVLEDGVPVAPGLFVGNARYYNPRIQRMESIEVLKGAASLRYGPSTIGGVVNYITKQPEDGVEISLRVGSWNSREATVEVGATSASQDAKFGAVITRASSDGFMDKDYDMTDVMLKTGMAIGDNQWLSIKYTDYQNDANISYRGLFLQEYKDGKRYNPAPDDYFLTGRRSLDLNHEWEISETAKLNTLIYGSEIFRDYWRYSTDNAASAEAGRWIYTDNLAGNNRSFERFGVESRLQLQHGFFGVASEAELGLRYMDEEMLDQNVAATRATPRTGTLNTDRIDSAESIAFYAQNRFLLTNKLAITAGLRAERYEQERLDKRIPNNQTNNADTSNTEWLPGVGATYQINSGLQIFASAYKAFSPALNADALTGLEDQKLDAERSVNIEAGLRGNTGRFNYEATIFRMDFDNQIIPANSNSDFQRTNGGKTLHQGVEGALAVDLGAGFVLKSNVTYIADAEFNGDRLDANGNITTPDGNRVTYTPEWIANLALEYSVGNLRSSLNVHHTSKQYTDVLNTKEIAENTSGFFTGQIDSYTIVDLNFVYDINKQFSLSGSVKNLADEDYIASLRQGIYVGPERSVDFGVRYRF